MKMKFNIYILFILAATSLQSCLFQEDDIFDKSASERIEAAVEEYKEVLLSAKNGWHLEYCPGEDYSMGGINMFIKFEKEKATMTSELGSTTSSAGTNVTTYYRVIPEQSVMLTFDTYNDIIHYFGEPQGSNANLQGDYEFIIMSATPEEVILQGKRYKNKMRMVPVDEKTSWSTIIRKLSLTADRSFLATYNYIINGQKVGTAKRSSNTNTFIVTDNNKNESELSFIYTDTGFKLLKPIYVDGAEIKNFNWSSTPDEAGVFTSVDESSASVTLEAFYPENYAYYADFLGSYTMTYSELAFDSSNKPYFRFVETNATLQRKLENKSYSLSGMPDALTSLEISYDRSTGAVSYKTGTQVSVYGDYYLYQTIGTSDSYMPSYVGYNFILDGIIEQTSPLCIAFKDTGWGSYYFGEPVTSIVIDAYGTAIPTQSSFSGYAQWYRDVVITKKGN